LQETKGIYFGKKKTVHVSKRRRVEFSILVKIRATDVPMLRRVVKIVAC
jgi:hypothetical protein